VIYLIEVEVKARVNEFDSIKKSLLELNAKKIRTERQEDTYFNAPHRDFAVTDEALRIRKIPNGDNLDVFITYKGAKIDKSSKTRQEFEVSVSDVTKTKNIFESLGFKLVATVVKDREIYHFNDFIITLDTVKKAGIFVEIEKDLEDGEDFEETLQEIFKLYEKLGITEGFERKSYLELTGI
jgi:adenylate cyclase class 2